MVKEQERLRSGLSKEQRTNLVNKLFYAGFNVDDKGNVYAARSGARPRVRGHDVAVGYINIDNPQNGYYMDIINLNYPTLKEDHTELKEISKLEL
jgi:hypothetical protein